MKTTLLSRTARSLIALFVSSNVIAQAQLPFRPLADAPANAQEQQQLDSLFAEARAASANVSPGTNAGYQRRQLSIELNAELESFVATHTNSAWTPGVRLWLARDAHLNCAYSTALNHFTEAWIAARGAGSIAARQISGEAMGGLAMSLALAGRLSELDALEREASAGSHLLGTEWQRAFGISAWARKHPTLAYKCGLYCLDQLGRLTQPGQFESEAITSIESSTNGFTAADLVQIASGVGLRMHAAPPSPPQCCFR